MIYLFLWIFFVLLFLKIYNRISVGRCYSHNVMAGQVVIVTGANRGIGFETALDLAKRGAKVILACRSEEKGIKTANYIQRLSKNKNVFYRHLDLSSFASIRRFVKDFKASEAKLDVLINNASIIGTYRSKTEDGIQNVMQVNHFGPFLLTLLLIPMLIKANSGKVINLTSNLHRLGNKNNLNDETSGQFQMYCNSKLCNILFTNELSRRLEEFGITVNSVHPGQVNTGLYKNTRLLGKIRHLLLCMFLKNPRDGAQTSIFLAVSDDCDGITGKYFVDCGECPMSAKASDPNLAAKLWHMSEEIVGVKAEDVL